MKKISFILFTVLVFGCSNPFNEPYFVTFEEAISELVEEYGEPTVIRDTYCYVEVGATPCEMPEGNDNVRNRVLYWTVDPPRPTDQLDFAGRVITYSAVSVEVWRQNDPNDYRRSGIYGWDVLRITRGNFQFIE